MPAPEDIGIDDVFAAETIDEFAVTAFEKAVPRLPTPEKEDDVQRQRRVTALGAYAHAVANGLRQRFRTQASNGEAKNMNSSEEHNTDVGNARRLVAAHGDVLRYCHPWKSWLHWDGRHWVRDTTGEVERRAKDTVAAMYGEAARLEDEVARKASAAHAMKSEHETRLRAMVSVARSEPGVPVLPEDLDRDPYLLNCLNGTVDLRTAELRPHRQRDLLTKCVPVAYDAKAHSPTWHAFLHQVMGGNEQVISFLQRAVGYSLTGDVAERCLFVLYGDGANGKSTFLEALRAVLGDYAMRTPVETLLTKRDGAIPNDIARLKGARFATASETEAGRKLAEALVKDLTGGDTLVARFMHAEFFEFRPEFKLWLGTNHKPVVRGTDQAIWDRIRLIPFTVRIAPAEQDKQLLAKLREELPGILAWAVQGCMDWQRQGLGTPAEVHEATATYREEMDPLRGFFADRCVLRPEVSAASGALWKAYLTWAAENGERPLARHAFIERLRAHGCTSDRGTKGARYWQGIGLRAAEGDVGDGR